MGVRQAIVVLALLAFAVAVPEARDRREARAAYQKAVEYHRKLLDVPRAKRAKKRYNYAVFLYRKVLDADPTYGACDDSLFAIASLFDELADRFGSERDLDRAVEYYEFLAAEYPLTKHRREALKRAEELREIKRAANAPPPPPEPAPAAADWADVEEIRYWSSEDYTRVVIQLEREVEFEKAVLHDPDRIYFDLRNSRLPSSLERAYDVNGVFLSRVRVAENQPGVVRVVLDFDKISSSSVFALYDPYRIVIDTRGPRGRADATVKTAEAVISLEDGSSSRELVTEKPAVPKPNSEGHLSLTRVLGLKVGKVALDPGHGGHDTGTIGPNGLREKDLVLDVAKRVRDLIQQRLGAEVVMTRDDDEFIPLERRTAIANKEGADLFVSIHANASRRKHVSGVETFVLSFASGPDEREVASRENATSQRNIRELEDLLRKIALGDYNEESKDLALIVQRNLHDELVQRRPGWPNRGVKKAPFIVLVNSNMPSILTEIGFISNPSDEKFLKKEEAKDHVAEALYKGIEEYLRSLGGSPVSDRTAAASGR